MTERLDLETNGQNCSSLLESIILNLHPDNNTALVIDDEVEIQEMIGMFLKSLGHECVTIGTASDGLKQIVISDPKLVFLDIHLPLCFFPYQR